MNNSLTTANIMLWGQSVGAVSWFEDRGYAVFEYEPGFLHDNLNIAPVHMGLEQARESDAIFLFPGLNRQTFLGLPGLLADCLPDKFGNSLIDVWLAKTGRDFASFNPVERLCYMGQRGMGALEFQPAYDHEFSQSTPLHVEALVELAQEITTGKKQLDVQFDHQDSNNAAAMLDILRVGTSAGGARPKAIIAMNSEGHIISGQTTVPKGYEYWLLKFDGVHDLELGAPKQFGRIEYAYYLMAKAAGIEMMPCRLLEENGRAHFLTKRFDREKLSKVHMQTLCGIAHYDYNMAGVYSYEQAFAVMRTLKLSKAEQAKLYRRMVFNVVARNQDDHTKNISFLMDQTGAWTLSPAYDVTYSHNPHGKWTNQHQMLINGKRDDFSRDDLLVVGESLGMKDVDMIIDEVCSAVIDWPKHASDAELSSELIAEIARFHRAMPR